MPQQQHRNKVPVVRSSAYPGARLDSSSWRNVLGGRAIAPSSKKSNAVVPHSPAQSAGLQGPHATAHALGDDARPRQHRLTFLQNFGLLGIPVLCVVVVSIAWTALLLVLNVAPNATANYIMNTAEFDGGSFWLIIDPSRASVATAVVGLSLVLVGYFYTLLKMTWWQNDNLNDSNSKAFFACVTRALVREGTSQQQILAFWTDLSSFQGQRRKFWVRRVALESQRMTRPDVFCAL